MFTKDTIVDTGTGDYEGKLSWPAFFFGPEGASAQFANQDEVPEGWVDDPKKLDKPAAKGKGKAAPAESPYKDKTDAEVVAELKLRNIDFNDKWPRTKLEGLLIDDDAKKAGK